MVVQMDDNNIDYSCDSVWILNSCRQVERVFVDVDANIETEEGWLFSDKLISVVNNKSIDSKSSKTVPPTAHLSIQKL